MCTIYWCLKVNINDRFYSQLKSPFFLNENKNMVLGNLAQDVSYLWRDIPVPVIAVLHGMCFGGGASHS